MEALIGLLIIAAGSFCQSSSYVPINKVKGWSWETFWIMQGIFAWIVFPIAGALASVPEGASLCGIIGANGAAAAKAAGYGILWGIGGLTFGLSMRYLGVALGQSISLGTCAAFGTLLPAIFGGDNLFKGEGLILLLGVCLTIAGISVIGYAGSLRSRNMSKEEREAAIKDFALTKGLLVALLAGVMSACFNLGLDAGKPLVAEGMSPLMSSLPATMMVTLGGFLTNATWCIYKIVKSHSGGELLKRENWISNLLFCALAGLLWYSQFFGLSLGKGFFTEGSVLDSFAWCILMALNVIFSNVWGIILKEWKGAGCKAATVLVCGLALLILSLVFPNLF